MATENKYPTSYQKPTSNVPVLADKKILQYPLDLGSSDKDKFGVDQHYMIFKINTDTKTTALKDDVKSGSVNIATGKRQGTGQGGSALRGTFQKNDDKDLRLKYGDKAVDDQRWVVQKGMTRLDKVIVLPMPNDHVVVTSVEYDDHFGSSDLTKMGDYMNQSGTEMAADLYTLGKNTLAVGGINTLKADLTDMQSMLAEERLAQNPKKEVMFDSFGFRNFSFSYQFAPKTQEESDMVHDIIETFRYYALPEITGGTMFYIFPSEFEISFMFGAKENPHIPRIATSVLKNITVNYAPNSVWSSLPNGAPLSLAISLTFIELELIDRSRVFSETNPITSGY